MNSGGGGWKPTGALLVATAVWGTTFVTVKDALEASDVFTFLALRFVVGAVAAAALAIALRHRNARAGREAGAEQEGLGSRERGEGGEPAARSPGGRRDLAAWKARAQHELSAGGESAAAGRDPSTNERPAGDGSAVAGGIGATESELGESEASDRTGASGKTESELGESGGTARTDRSGATEGELSAGRSGAHAGRYGATERELSPDGGRDSADRTAMQLRSRDERTRSNSEETEGQLSSGGSRAPAIRSESGVLQSFRAVLRPGLQLGVLLFGGYALQTLGLQTTTPARSAFITGLTVIFVPFVSWWMNGLRPPTRAFIAPLVALIGLQRLTGVTFSGEVPAGDALTLGCAAVYAVHIVGMGKWGKGEPPLELTAVQLSVVAVLSTFTLPFIERRFDPTPGYWAAVVFTGVFASALAIAVQAWAQVLVSATRAAVIFSLEPVFALAAALFSGLGWPSPAELVGCGFILAAVLISEVELPALGRARLLGKGP